MSHDDTTVTFRLLFFFFNKMKTERQCAQKWEPNVFTDCGADNCPSEFSHLLLRGPAWLLCSDLYRSSGSHMTWRCFHFPAPSWAKWVAEKKKTKSSERLAARLVPSPSHWRTPGPFVTSQGDTKCWYEGKQKGKKTEAMRIRDTRNEVCKKRRLEWSQWRRTKLSQLCDHSLFSLSSQRTLLCLQSKYDSKR